MAGGLMQIVSYGSRDLFLTGNPEITFFKTVFRRHTNFSLEAIKVTFDDPTGFGTTSNVTLQKIGDLVYNTYLVVDIPSFQYQRTLDQTNIDTLTSELTQAQANYNLVQTFLSYNMTAYRDAYNLYLSNNITYSDAMISIITADLSGFIGSPTETEFANLIADDYYAEQPYVMEHGGVLFRYYDMDGNLGNISLNSISEYWGTPTPIASTVPKQTTMNVINFLINNCISLDKKYYYKMYAIHQQLNDAYQTNYKFAWVDKLGTSLIEYVEFWIGGNPIDKHYGMWLDIWHSLMGKRLQEEQYDRMIGNVISLTSFDRTTKPAYTLKIPLKFFFNKYSGLALPLIALQYNDVTMRFKFRKFSQCSYVEADANNDPVSLDDIIENLDIDMNATLLVEYVYLDTDERRRFAQSSHEYLIDQLQINFEKNLSNQTYQFDLSFQQPCYGLIWVIQNSAFLSNPDGHTKCYWNLYTTTVGGTNPILTSELLINDQIRFDQLEGNYFNYLQPYVRCNNSPAEGINSYWFSLFPSEQQPSGTCNMSRLPKVRLQLTIDPYYYNNDGTYTLSVFAVNYNVLRIIGGFGNTAYVQ